MHRLVPLSLAIAAVVTGCGDTDRARPESATTAAPSTTAPGQTPTTPTDRPEPGRVVTTGPSAYGTMLFDRTGQAIYLFDAESSAEPECYGACAKAWPPVLTEGPPRAGKAARSSLLGTTRRKDGTLQVTYDGHPLYFYAHEGKNEVLCHNITEFGGLWLVVMPDGRPAP